MALMAIWTQAQAGDTAGIEMMQLGWSFFISTCGLIICYYWHRLIES
jgi:hypothetical protein